MQSVEKKQKSTQPPKLYDLTSLQRDGNRLFGYTAQQVLDYAQALYEKKLLTYPRTDSNYLTEDMKDTIPELCELAASALPFSVAALSVDASRIINNGKVSDHHALLPTKQISGADLSSLLPGAQYPDIGNGCGCCVLWGKNIFMRIPPLFFSAAALLLRQRGVWWYRRF